MYIRISKLTIIGSDNGLSYGRRQAIIWTYAGILFVFGLLPYLNKPEFLNLPKPPFKLGVEMGEGFF